MGIFRNKSGRRVDSNASAGSTICSLVLCLLLPLSAKCEPAEYGLPNVPVYFPEKSGRLVKIDRRAASGVNWRYAILGAKPKLVFASGRVEGVQFGKVPVRSPLRAIGLRRGDVVQTLNGVRLNDPFQIPYILIKAMQFKMVRIGYVRKGTGASVFVNATGRVKKSVPFPKFKVPVDRQIGNAAAMLSENRLGLYSSDGVFTREMMLEIAKKGAFSELSSVRSLYQDLSAL